MVPTELAALLRGKRWSELTFAGAKLGCRTLLGLLGSALLLAGCTPKETKVLLQPTHALGQVLAEEAAQLAGPKKQVAIISPDASWGPLSLAEETFVSALKQRGFTMVRLKPAALGDPMRSGKIGLKGADFLDALQQGSAAGAIVSFAGAPLLSPADAARMSGEHPPVLVVATATLGNIPGVPRDPVQIAALLESKAIQLAIIDGPEPDASSAASRDPVRQLFSANYRLLRRTD